MDLTEYIVSETFEKDRTYGEDDLDRAISGFLNSRGLETKTKSLKKGLLKQGILREVEDPGGEEVYRVSLGYKGACDKSLKDPTFGELQDFVSDEYDGLFKRKFAFSEEEEARMNNINKKLILDVTKDHKFLDELKREIIGFEEQTEENKYTRTRKKDVGELIAKREEALKIFRHFERTPAQDLHYGPTLVEIIDINDEKVSSIVSRLNYRNLPEVLRGLEGLVSEYRLETENISNGFSRYKDEELGRRFTRQKELEEELNRTVTEKRKMEERKTEQEREMERLRKKMEKAGEAEKEIKRVEILNELWGKISGMDKEIEEAKNLSGSKKEKKYKELKRQKDDMLERVRKLRGLE